MLSASRQGRDQRQLVSLGLQPASAEARKVHAVCAGLLPRQASRAARLSLGQSQDALADHVTLHGRGASRDGQHLGTEQPARPVVLGCQG